MHSFDTYPNVRDRGSWIIVSLQIWLADTCHAMVLLCQDQIVP